MPPHLHISTSKKKKRRLSFIREMHHVEGEIFDPSGVSTPGFRLVRLGRRNVNIHFFFLPVDSSRRGGGRHEKLPPLSKSSGQAGR